MKNARKISIIASTLCLVNALCRTRVVKVYSIKFCIQISHLVEVQKTYRTYT